MKRKKLIFISLVIIFVSAIFLFANAWHNPKKVCKDFLATVYTFDETKANELKNVMETSLSNGALQRNFELYYSGYNQYLDSSAFEKFIKNSYVVDLGKHCLQNGIFLKVKSIDLTQKTKSDNDTVYGYSVQISCNDKTYEMKGKIVISKEGNQYLISYFEPLGKRFDFAA